MMRDAFFTSAALILGLMALVPSESDQDHDWFSRLLAIFFCGGFYFLAKVPL